MISFSAFQAVSPAIDRTKSYLFHPFKWSTYLKLAAVACITEGFSTNLNFSSNLPSSSHTGVPAGFHFSNEIIALIALAVLVCIALSIIIYYLITRLRFVFFHCLAHQTREIRPVWGLYRVQALRFFKLSLIVALICLVILALAALPFVFGFINFFRAFGPGSQFDVAGFLALFLPLLAVVFLLMLIFYTADVIMRDFMLPHMALENASVRAAWRSVCARIAAEKGSFLLYAILRLVLPAIAMMALFMILAIPLLIIFGILAFCMAGLNSLLADATGLYAFILIVLEVVVGLTAFAFGLFLSFSLGGPVATWIRNYALLFYGGRYQALGDMLSPPPPPVPNAPQAA